MSKSTKLFLITFVIALITAAITNPKKADFVDYYETQFVENSQTMVEEIIHRVAKELVGGIADQAKHDNYVIFSVFTMGESKYIGLYGNFIELRKGDE